MADSFIRRLHAAIYSGAMRQVIFPVEDAAGIGVALGAAGNSPAYSVLVDIALPALIVVPTFVVGFTFDAHSAACVATVCIGSTRAGAVNYANAAAVTAAGAAAILASHRATTRAQLIAIAAGQGYCVILRYPVLIAAGEGITASWQTAAGAETGNLTVMAVQGI